MTPLSIHAGLPQISITLSFPAISEDYTAFGIYHESLNGQNPNMDIINTIVRIGGYDGMTMVVHDGLAERRYQDQFWRTAKVLTESIGLLKGYDHEVFQRLKYFP